MADKELALAFLSACWSSTAKKMSPDILKKLEENK